QRTRISALAGTFAIPCGLIECVEFSLTRRRKRCKQVENARPGSITLPPAPRRFSDLAGIEERQSAGVGGWKRVCRPPTQPPTPVPDAPRGVREHPASVISPRQLLSGAAIGPGPRTVAAHFASFSNPSHPDYAMLDGSARC